MVRVHVHALGGKGAVVLHVAVGQVTRVAGAAGVARIGGRLAEGVLAQRGVGLGFVALQRAEAPQVDQEGRHRVAGHDVGVVVGVAPARQPATLLVDGQQRAADVARALRAQQGEQLVLRAVGVPQREILVVGPAVGAVDRIVVAAVAAVGIAAGERLQQGVV